MKNDSNGQSCSAAQPKTHPGQGAATVSTSVHPTTRLVVPAGHQAPWTGLPQVGVYGLCFVLLQHGLQGARGVIAQQVGDVTHCVLGAAMVPRVIAANSLKETFLCETFCQRTAVRELIVEQTFQ